MTYQSARKMGKVGKTTYHFTPFFEANVQKTLMYVGVNEKSV